MKNFDNLFLTEKIRFVAGIDEAGRGPLAGPVVAAAVIFHPDVYIPGVNDSKVLSEEEREALLPEILSKAAAYSVSVISNHQIDRINILQASLLAMRVSADRLKISPDLLLIDGNRTFKYKVPVIPLIKGDGRSFAIAAASVIAKVARDRIMTRLCPKFPNYLWSKNKGYPTQEHIQAVKIYGATCLHRKSFLRKILSSQYEPQLQFETEMAD